MDLVVKRVAERAGLNCGRCVTEHGNKCEEGPYRMIFFLLKSHFAMGMKMALIPRLRFA